MEEDIKPQSGTYAERDNKGKFLPGNQCGKLPREKIYSTEELVQAIKEVEEEDKVDVLKHYVRQSLIDNRVMIDLIGKKIPKITINEIKGTGLPFNLFVTQFIEKEKDISCEMIKGVISMKVEKELEKEKGINKIPKPRTVINKGENASPPPCG